MKKAVVDTGYRPTVVQSRIDDISSKAKDIATASKTDAPNKTSKGEIPEPIRSALAQAKRERKLTFINFHAVWCGACKILDRTTLKDPTVISSLENFVFIKVDADEFPMALKYFDVFGMPTLLALNEKGEVLYRQVGLLSADELSQRLNALAHE